MNFNATSTAGQESKDRTVFSRPPLLDALSIHPSPHVQHKFNLPSTTSFTSSVPSTNNNADLSSSSPLFGAFQGVGAANSLISLDDFSSSGVHSQSDVSPTPPPTLQPPPPSSLPYHDPNQNLLSSHNGGAFHGHGGAFHGQGV